MVDIVLSAVEVGMAAPEFASTVIRSLNQLADMGKKYKNAPKAVQDISVFAGDLSRGKLTLDVHLADWAAHIDGLDPTFEDILRDYLQRLQEAVVETTTAIERLYDKDGLLKRLYFPTLGERRVLRAANKFHRWQNDFVQLVELIEKERRLTDKSLLLSTDQLMVFSNGDGDDLVPISQSTMLFRGKGEFKAYGSNSIKSLNLLIERRSLPVDEDSVARVASRLNRASCDRGILECLGYRLTNGIELIFHVPTHLDNPRLLDDVIGTYRDHGQIPYAFEQRLKLCHDLCRAVFSVHTSNFVHKNIRPENILLFQDANDDHNLNGAVPNLGHPFLTDWHMLRTFDDLSSRCGANDWMKNIYRHPQRQSLQPQARYNLGHDLYSLGVTLLEITLWESFVKCKDPPVISERYKEMALNLGEIPISRMDTSKLFKKLTIATLSQKVMIKLAEDEVPWRMGTSLSRLIVACLTCLEGGMGDAEDFNSKPNDSALRFHQLMNESFPGYDC